MPRFTFQPTLVPSRLDAAAPFLVLAGVILGHPHEGDCNWIERGGCGVHDNGPGAGFIHPTRSGSVDNLRNAKLRGTAHCLRWGPGVLASGPCRCDAPP